VLATAIMIAGLIIFLVPGLILMVLFCVVGPIVVIEGASAWRSLWRSAALVRPHFFLALVVIVLPTFAEESLTSWLERFGWYEGVFVRVPVDVVVTLVVGGVIGVLEVTLAHALIADRRRRRTERDRASSTAAGVADPEAPPEEAAGAEETSAGSGVVTGPADAAGAQFAER